MAKVGSTTKSENEAPEYAGVCVKLKTVDNGVVVTAYPENDMGHETTNVYQDLETALKEIPAIISVCKEQAKDDGKEKEIHAVAVEEDY